MKPNKKKSIQRLRRALSAVPELRRQRPDSLLFKKWIRDTEVAITSAFGEETRHISDFKHIGYSGPINIGGFGTDDTPYYLKGLGEAKAVLTSLIEEIEDYWDDDSDYSTQNETATRTSLSTIRVFVVHGHDDAAKHLVDHLLRQVGLDPVILSDKLSRGKTIIEKFEANSDVGFAVALLTPDDTGSARGNVGNSSRFRARQNVIFELGFFIGKLGRERVCALTKGDLEIPSDYSGVVYITLDNDGGWKLTLLKELRAAGFSIDANALIDG